MGVNYYITESTGYSIGLDTRCGRENQQPAESWAPGLRLSSPGEWERNADGHKSGGSICCSSVRSPTPSHTQPFQKKGEVYFLRTLSLIFIIVSSL